MAKAGWSKWGDAQREEIRQLLSDGTTSCAEIGRTYDIPGWQIRAYAKHINMHSKFMRSPKRADAMSLRSVEAQIESAIRQQEELRERLRALNEQRAALSIRFERDGVDGVVVHGIAPEPIKAPAERWISFFSHDGPRRLREFIGSWRAR